MKNVFGVLGGGSWGTALVKILLENNKYVNWYLRNEETIEFIKKFKKNPNYLRALNIDTSKTKLSLSRAGLLKLAKVCRFWPKKRCQALS